MFADGLLPSGFTALFIQNTHVSHLINLNMDFLKQRHTYALEDTTEKSTHFFIKQACLFPRDLNFCLLFIFHMII